MPGDRFDPRIQRPWSASTKSPLAPALQRLRDHRNRGFVLGVEVLVNCRGRSPRRIGRLRYRPSTADPCSCW